MGRSSTRKALAWALNERLIAAAALDVYEREPIVHEALLGARERRARASPRQRDSRDADRDDRPCHQQRARRARRPAAADAAMKLPKPTPAPERQSGAVMRRLGRAIERFEEPAVEKIAEDQQEDPFQVLIATMLSAQTRDAVTHEASTRLFKVARTPKTMAKLTVAQIRASDLSRQLLSQQGGPREADVPSRSCPRFGGRVPSTMEDLLTLPGVGRKTANLVLILAHRSRAQHLRRHPRASHLEPARLGSDAYAGGDRAGALQSGSPAVVADHQPLSGDLGSECLPPGIPALRQLCNRRSVPENWGGSDRQARARCGHGG